MDLFAHELRDIGIAKVLDHNTDWKDAATMLIQRYMQGQELTGEEIRVKLTNIGVSPDHHNAWGGLIIGLVKKGTLIDTGKVKRMATAKSHARRTPVWRVAG